MQKRGGEQKLGMLSPELLIKIIHLPMTRISISALRCTHTFAHPQIHKCTHTHLFSHMHKTLLSCLLNSYLL